MTSFSQDIITIAGGTGFLGTQIVKLAAAAGLRVRVLTRHPECAYILKTSGVVGQIVGQTVDYSDKSALEQALKGSRYVVNCLGILAESGKKTFAKIHKDYAGNLAAAAAAVGAERFVQISALGVDQNESKYASSKRDGEKAVLAAFPDATILRPSVMFGPEDTFFNRFARMAQILPVIPLVGGGNTKFQPVYVGDVASAVMAVLQLPAVPAFDPRGHIYALGGPEIISFRSLIEWTLAQTGHKRKLMALPFPLAAFKAVFLQFFPQPLQLTPDQVKSLRVDNVVREGEKGFADLGMYPTALELVVPPYLESYQTGGKFARMRSEVLEHKQEQQIEKQAEAA
jgi:uncharacterized protein YbjT (DUF2867 family)